MRRAGAYSLLTMVGYFVQVLRPAIFLALLVSFGSAGYMAIEGWSPIDALYMSVITVSTVGFGEAHRLSAEGKLFTMGLIMGGVIFYGIAIDAILKLFINRKFRQFFEEARVKDRMRKLKNHYIVCGGGRMALSTIRELDRAGKAFVVLETNPDSIVMQIYRGSMKHWLVVERDALIEENLIEARIEHAVGLAAVLPTDADNLFVVLSARRLNPKLTIQSRIARESTRDKMLQAGADKVISPYMVGGLQMARSMLNPRVDDFMEIVMDQVNYEFEMKIHHMEEDDAFAEKSLRETDFRRRGFIAIGVRMVFAPDSNFVLKPGMEILLLGSGEEKPTNVL